jgi:glycosidase
VQLAAAFALALTASVAQARCEDAPRATSALRHVASPDWREQIVYFAMIDRFDDGDAHNNDQHQHEYAPGDPARYSGGDLCGLTRRLDYLRELGATALWITPPVAHQWWDGSANYGGYHGYWGENFRRVDAHFGTLADYQRLAEGLHARSMYLIQDIVVNHVGNYFRYRGGWDAHDPSAHFSFNAGAQRRAPTQWPFSRNDARDPAQRRAAIYHWTPDIADFADPVQEKTWQLAGLDDLDTENPVVRRTLRQSYARWIDAVGVDGFRVDTAFYVPPDFFRDFLHSEERGAPGVLRVAAARGRRNFLVFGEGFGLDHPYDDAQTHKIDGYVADAKGPLLPGMLNFPLYAAATDVFARGHPTAEVGYRLRGLAQRPGDVHLMPSFVDNHDVDRFLAGGTPAGLQQALLLIMTVPGIPVIYYGTEQGFTAQRAAMFARGVDAGGVDHFDTGAPLYRYLQRVIRLRREHTVLSHGMPTVLAENRAGAGGIAWRMSDGDAAMLIALNSADTPMLLERVDTGLPAGTRLEGVFGIETKPEDLVVDGDGRVDLILPPRAGLVWQRAASTIAPERSAAELGIDPLPAAEAQGTLVLHGRSRGIPRFDLVLDGDLARAQSVTPAADGRWQARLDVASLLDASIEHRVIAWAGTQRIASTARTFRARPAWTKVLTQDDPVGDDAGSTGTYTYPSDASWGNAHPDDITRVSAYTAGDALRLDVQLRDVLSAWNAPNGFDHLALTAFVQLPFRSDGETSMPLQQASVPRDMHWQYRLRVDGWRSAWFGSRGADASHEGAVLSPSPRLAVDRDNRTLSLIFPAGCFGAGMTPHGAQVYLTTWDYDGGYRPLAPVSGAFTYGGAAAEAAKVMDDAMVTLPGQ